MGGYHHGFDNDYSLRGKKITLKRNPNNEYDKNAIEIWVGFKMIGYVQKHIAESLAGTTFNLAAKLITFNGSGNHIEILNDGKPNVFGSFKFWLVGIAVLAIAASL